MSVLPLTVVQRDLLNLVPHLLVILRLFLFGLPVLLSFVV